uniref:Uncharacterized protein n=1 Tax=Cryptomonas curvata TaxID=233186 RepID=A0A7S0M099_9CRYP
MARASSDMVHSKRKSLFEILSDVENAKVELRAEMQMEESSAQSTAAMLSTTFGVISALDLVLVSLGTRLAELCRAGKSDKSARCRVESLLWSEKQRAKQLEVSLEQTSLIAGHAMEECNRLFKQLEDQTASSNDAIQQYKTKLQEALKEEVALLGVVQQLEEGKAALETRLSSLEATLSHSEDVKLDLSAGLREQSLSAQNLANLLCVTEDNATTLDAILTSKKSLINNILFAATAAKCKQDNLIWFEHQRARALEHALSESNQTASDTADECAQLNMLLQQQWEEKVLVEKQAQQAAESSESTVSMLKSKLQAALQEGMTLLESVQLLEQNKSDLERHIRELQDEQAKRALAQTEALNIQQTCLADILSGLKTARADLHVEQADLMDVGQNTGLIVSASGDLLSTTETSLSSLGAVMAKLLSEALAERQTRCRLEYLLWAEQQRVAKLETGYSESNSAGLETLTECSLLSSQVQEIWDGQGQLRENLSQSEASIQALQTKLQSALQEQVKLVECVQQLESDKASLEEHLNAVHEGLSQTALGHAEIAAERKVLIKSLKETESARDKFQGELNSAVAMAVESTDVLSSAEASTEILVDNLASLGIQLTDMQAQLSAEKHGRLQLEQTLEIQLRADDEAASILVPAVNVSATLLENVSLLGQQTVEALAWALKERSSRCKLEKVLWAAQQRVFLLEQGLVESNQTVDNAVEECVGLSSQVRLLSVEKVNLEQELRDYTAKSEAAVSDLKTKLQTSLEEGVKLLESLQQLELDNATLEERISAMQEGLSQTALAHADTAAERRSLLQKLSELEMSRQKLQAELSAESTAALNTSMLLNAVENHALLLDKDVENLGLQMSKVSVDLAAVRGEKGWLEQLLSAENRRVDKLERELAECSKAAALAVQVKKRWEEMEELEVKPEEGASEIDLATNALKVKLQAALKEEMKLLERVQQLDSEKVLLEERCSALQEGLSQMALAHAELATEQRSLAQSLTELDIARRSLQDELHMEMAAGLDSAAMLQVTSGLSTTVDQHLISLSERLVLLGERMSWVCSEASKEKRARCSLEKLLWAKQQHVVELELSLMDSNQAVGEAVTECLRLSSQVRQLWEEKVNLTDQLRAGSIALDETNQQMRAKLESALKDELILLEQIQQLESVKASREAQLAVATEDASRAACERSVMTEVMRQALLEILSNVDSAKTQLNAEVQASLHVASMLTTSQEVLTTVDERIMLLGQRMVAISEDASTEKSARCKFEQLLWAEKQHVRRVGISLLECKQLLEESVAECGLLSGQVLLLCQEKLALQAQLQESNDTWESAQQDLKSKLQTALKEGVELLERVQLLEEKSLLKDAERAQLIERLAGPEAEAKEIAAILASSEDCASRLDSSLATFQTRMAETIFRVTATILETSIESLSPQLAEARLRTIAAQSAGCLLERALGAEEQMVRMLKRALVESSEAVDSAVRECAGLAKQVQDKWDENNKLGLLLRESEGAIKSLTSRLHTALREGAHLMQRVEQLEADTTISSSTKPPLTALSADARLYVAEKEFYSDPIPSAFPVLPQDGHDGASSPRGLPVIARPARRPVRPVSHGQAQS